VVSAVDKNPVDLAVRAAENLQNTKTSCGFFSYDRRQCFERSGNNYYSLPPPFIELSGVGVGGGPVFFVTVVTGNYKIAGT
jgi:hypothetical protein